MGVKEEEMSGVVDNKTAECYALGRDAFFDIEVHFLYNPEDYIERYVDKSMGTDQKNQYLLGIIDSAIVYDSLDVAFFYYLNLDRSENPEAVKKLIKATRQESFKTGESLEDQLNEIKFIIDRKYVAEVISVALVEFKELYLYSKGA